MHALHTSAAHIDAIYVGAQSDPVLSRWTCDTTPKAYAAAAAAHTCATPILQLSQAASLLLVRTRQHVVIGRVVSITHDVGNGLAFEQIARLPVPGSIAEAVLTHEAHATLVSAQGIVQSWDAVANQR